MQLGPSFEASPPFDQFGVVRRQLPNAIRTPVGARERERHALGMFGSTLKS